MTRILIPFLVLACTLSPFALAEGVTSPLFNGQNLDGWHVSGCEVAVQDGVMVLQSGNGLVRTDFRYRDFVLDLEWRALKGDAWDSGIYFRCELPPEGKPWPARYQVNLRQGQEGDVGGLPDAKSKDRTKPGEWNRFTLTVRGDKAALAINGEPAWESAGLESPDGYIALQAEVPLGGQFEFRNIQITELGYEPLFNGKDLSGWEGAGQPAEKCWKVEDGLVVCTGEKGPWLRSPKEFEDFSLRLDYKLKAGGNSGVYVRVPENGDHHGEGAGVEIQLLDDHAPRYKDLKPYQFTGSVYAIAPADPRVSKAPEQWNTIEINCRGNTYQITHNGLVVVDVDAEDFPELAKRLPKGFLGLQNHSEEVWFRNVRIGPPRE